MAFRSNSYQQFSMEDSLNHLTDRERKMLEKSWAVPFAEIVFPAIEEEPFSVLYSNKASRPNTPVNVLVGALILKELLNLTDDEVVESLMFDIRFQYALHTTSFKEQPLSDRSLGRFRERNTAYEAEHKVDLIKNCIMSLTDELSVLMGIAGNLKRMDSFMVASNIKHMSRLELLYTSVANLVKQVERKGQDTVPKTLKHYLEEDDRNEMIYHRRSEEVDSRIDEVLRDAKRILRTCQNNYDQDSEYLLLLRVLREQTRIDETGNYELKSSDDNTFASDTVQNPADPDATYRIKGSGSHIGYVANVVESSSENGSLITSWQYEQNTYSDSRFLRDYLAEKSERIENELLVADGAYASLENQELAREQGVELITTDLVGRKPKDILADFIFSADGKRVLACAAGHSPKSCSYMEQTKTCRISFHKTLCENCTYRSACQPNFKKFTAVMCVSSKAKARAESLRLMKTDKYRKLARYRNGVESIPSLFKRKYKVDDMPVRTHLKSKLFFNLKVAANNVKKFLTFNSRDKCALNAQISLNPV